MLKTSVKNVCLHMTLSVIFIVALSACQSGVDVKETDSGTPQSKKLLVLPFSDMAGIYGEKSSVRCPIDNKVFVTGKVPDGTVDILFEYLNTVLKKRNDFELLPPDRSIGIMDRIVSKSGKALPPEASWLKQEGWLMLTPWL